MTELISHPGPTEDVLIFYWFVFFQIPDVNMDSYSFFIHLIDIDCVVDNVKIASKTDTLPSNWESQAIIKFKINA